MPTALAHLAWDYSDSADSSAQFSLVLETISLKNEPSVPLRLLFKNGLKTKSFFGSGWCMPIVDSFIYPFNDKYLTGVLPDGRETLIPIEPPDRPFSIRYTGWKAHCDGPNVSVISGDGAEILYYHGLIREICFPKGERLVVQRENRNSIYATLNGRTIISLKLSADQKKLDGFMVGADYSVSINGKIPIIAGPEKIRAISGFNSTLSTIERDKVGILSTSIVNPSGNLDALKMRIEQINGREADISLNGNAETKTAIKPTNVSALEISKFQSGPARNRIRNMLFKHSDTIENLRFSYDENGRLLRLRSDSGFCYRGADGNYVVGELPTTNNKSGKNIMKYITSGPSFYIE